jgi:hypothetical protein
MLALILNESALYAIYSMMKKRLKGELANENEDDQTISEISIFELLEKLSIRCIWEQL